MAEEQADLWASQTLGDISHLKGFFEAAQKGLELHKENAAFIKTVYEINKALLLATIDPLFAAIDKILDEILKLLEDLRGLGFYYLPVHAESVDSKSSLQKHPVTGGLFIGGKYYAKATRAAGGELVKASNLGTDKLAKDEETGEQLYVEDTTFQKFDGDIDLTTENAFIYINQALGLITLTPGGILQTIDKSFDDINDTPKLVGRQDFSVDTVLSEDYYMSGRPIFSASATVGGIIIIAGAPDFDKFMDILESFNKFMSLESFEKLIKNVKAIWTDDAKKKHTIKLSWVSNKNIEQGSAAGLDTDNPTEGYIEGKDTMGQFNIMDKKKTPKIMMNNRSAVKARITKVISTEDMIIEELTTPAHLIDSHNAELTSSMIKKRHTKIKENKNVIPYQQQELEVAYITSGDEFKKGDIVFEALPTTKKDIVELDDAGYPLPSHITYSSGGFARKSGDEDPSVAGSPAGTEYAQIDSGIVVVGKVVEEFYAGGQPEKPDWRGKRLEELIPPFGTLLDSTEGHVRGIKGTVQSAKKSIEPMIKYLDSKMAELQAFSNEVTEILELFAVGIPAAGIYTLYLAPKLGGTAEFRNRMLSAGGPRKPPEALKFCAGVCFLGGGPTGGPLIKSIEALALLLGMRKQTAAEAEQSAKMDELATPIFTDEKTYNAGDLLYYKGVNYECLLNGTSGELPLIKDADGKDIINSTYWKSTGAIGEEDAEVEVGDPRTPDELRVAKLEFLKATKKALGDILKKLNGTGGGAASLRKKIKDVPLYGIMDLLQSPPLYIAYGANEATFLELNGMRDQDLNELDLLVQRINEILITVEINTILETPDEDVLPGSLRSKGKSLLILKGEFVDEVDDFEAGQRRVRQNTTITIMDPSNPGSDSVRTVAYLSNTTVAVLDEAFDLDLEDALPYDVILAKADWETDYREKTENNYSDTHYYHPGYRLREFTAKANTISTYTDLYGKISDTGVITKVGTEYKDLPKHEEGSRFGLAAEGEFRNITQYPFGTIIEINGTVPISEGFVAGGGVELLLEKEEELAETWNAIGVSQDDLLIVTLPEGTFTKYIEEVIDDQHIAIDSIIQIGGADSKPVDLAYHDDWDFELSIGKKADKAQEDKIQNSRNKFADYLIDINAQADEVYDYLDKLSNEGW
jgi:hypothetical protein